MSTTSETEATGRIALELALGSELNALLSASRALTEASAAAFHPELPPAAFHLARWLHAYGPAKPSALAQAVAMDRSSTSSLIGRMRELGLVRSEQHPTDRRAVVVSLTPEGTERVLSALDLRGAAFTGRITGWTDEELRTFTRLLHAFAAPPHP